MLCILFPEDDVGKIPGGMVESYRATRINGTSNDGRRLSRDFIRKRHRQHVLTLGVPRARAAARAQYGLSLR